MSRFYYYLILINMVANIIASVPAILLHYHNDGAVISMLLSIAAGVLLITLYTKFFLKYPGKTLPELLEKTTSKWFYLPFVFLLAVLWFVAGLITLITFTFLLIRYLSPEMPIIMICLTLIFAVIFGCILKTDRVLYTVEMILIITCPLILFIFFKAYTSKFLNWDFVREAALYINQVPNWHSFSACFFLFLGAANLFIFNRFFTDRQKFGFRQILFIVLISIGTLFTTYFIPIGFNGFEGINDLVYPWISTTDSIRMEYFIIERVLFMFLLFYLGIAFLSILIHWHAAVEFLKFTFKLEKIKYKDKDIGIFLPLPIFVAISLYFVTVLTEYQLFRYSSYFYDVLVFIFPGMILLFTYINRRMKNEESSPEN